MHEDNSFLSSEDSMHKALLRISSSIMMASHHSATPAYSTKELPHIILMTLSVFPALREAIVRVVLLTSLREGTTPLSLSLCLVIIPIHPTASRAHEWL